MGTDFTGAVNLGVDQGMWRPRNWRDIVSAAAGGLLDESRWVDLKRELQEQIDAPGRHAWEPDRTDEAAAICGLTPDEFREMQDLKTMPYLRRTRKQNHRLDQLDHRWPPLLEQQAALVCGLTIEEFREMWRLERLGRRRHPHEQARLDELDASTRGATAATARKTVRMRGSYLALQSAHHSVKLDLATTRRELAAFDATARPLAPAAPADLARVTAELADVSQRHERMNGAVTATAEVPGRNGGALVLVAIQQEDGGVRYQVDRKPADADAEWGPGDGAEPYSSTAAGLRKVAKLATTLATPA